MLKKLPKSPALKKPATAPKRKAAPRPVKVKGSSVSEYLHDPETGDLTVTFASGKRYKYAKVSADLVSGLKDATSVGSYLHSNIFTSHKATKL